ncbi:DsrE family protein [Paenibacillus sp. IB182496]|uniref:DsrE family protein n=1 Tax=Paenibacillus sabuli TaxID=2772509 RepID=A0A927BPY1_9BACL|nr:DsrE family protein [Paenibacillus sabuli]MBD2843786.1 DsrE family protein [Paenibacillus sabuli]
MRLFIHSTHGPEAPSQADRALLIAETALREGHEVAMFLAGDAVRMWKEPVWSSKLGLGPDAVPVADRAARIAQLGGRIVLSRLSCETRGIEPDAQTNGQWQLGEPLDLVRMTEACDKMITYG